MAASRIKNRSIYVWVLIILYRVLLDNVYSNIVSVYFGYSGFVNNQTSESIFLSWAVMFLLVSLSNIGGNNRDGVSDDIMFMLLLISVIPFTTMLRYGQFESVYIVMNTVYWCCMFLFQRCIKRLSANKNKLVLVSDCKVLGEKKIGIIAIGLICIVLYISGKYAGFRLSFNLFDVYELRDEAASYAIPTIVSYIFSWSKSINPILLIYFICKKKKLWALLCVVVQLLSFGVDGLKSTLLVLVCVLAVGIISEKIIKSINVWIILSLIALLGISIALFYLLENYDIVTLVFRRVFFVPNQLSQYYFDFISDNVPDYFRGGFLRRFGFVSPYTMRIGNIIGETYFNDSSINCNNGLISDALFNLGSAGTFIMPMVWSITFYILDWSARGLNKRFRISVAFIVGYLMISTAYFTIILTYGLFLIILLLRFVERPDEKKGVDSSCLSVN